MSHSLQVKWILQSKRCQFTYLIFKLPLNPKLNRFFQLIHSINSKRIDPGWKYMYIHFFVARGMLALLLLSLVSSWIYLSSSRFVYCICAICTTLMFGKISNCWVNRIYLPQLLYVWFTWITIHIRCSHAPMALAIYSIREFSGKQNLCMCQSVLRQKLWTIVLDECDKSPYLKFMKGFRLY